MQPPRGRLGLRPQFGGEFNLAPPFACDLLKRASSSWPIRRSSLRPLNQILMGRRRLMFWSGLATPAGGMSSTCFLMGGKAFVRGGGRLGWKGGRE